MTAAGLYKTQAVILPMGRLCAMCHVYTLFSLEEREREYFFLKKLLQKEFYHDLADLSPPQNLAHV